MTLDDGALLYINLSPGVSAWEGIAKIAANGTLEWNKVFTTANTNQYFYINSLLQLKDGNYVIGGVVRYKNDSGLKYFVLIKLDSAGNIIWQHKYRNTYGSSVKDEVVIYDISEGKNGEIIGHIYQDEDSNIHGGGQSITLFSANGNIIWSNQYFGQGTFVKNSINVFMNNTINLWGQTYSTNSCFGNISGVSTLSCFQLNYTTGYMDAIKRFCIQPGKKSVWFSLQANSNEWVTTYRIANWHSFVFMYYPFDVDRVFLINEFDKDNNFLRSKLFSPPQGNAASPWLNYTFDVNDKTGEVVFNFSFTQSVAPYNILPYSFLVLLDSNLNLKQQFYMENAPPGALIGSTNFLQNNHLNYISSSNQKDNPLYQQFNYANIPEAITSDAFCNAKDSLFGNLTDHGLVPADGSFQWDNIRQNVYALNGDASLVVVSLPIQQTTYCKKISICDTLKIHGPSNSCLDDDTITFHVYINPTCFKRIEWQIDTSIVSIAQNPNDTSLVLKLKKPGVFMLYANLENCGVKDSMQIKINKPERGFSIIRDSMLCPGKTLLLKATEGFASYTWQNGNDSNSLLVAKPCLYKAAAIDGCGNIFKDSILVKLTDTSFAIPSNSSICIKDTLYINLPTGLTNISWYPGSNGFLRNNQLLFSPEQTTKYEISATFPDDCDIKQLIDIQVNICHETIFFPNAFTPNNDGLNDVFKPILGASLKYYLLTIFNRFGQKIFSSNNPSNGWDGRYLNSPQNAGSFVWQCIYQFYNKEIKNSKGTILLLR